MIKKEVIAAVAEKCGKTKKEVGEIIDSTLALISDELNKGNVVTLRNFGTFKMKEVKERRYLNPAKPGEYVISECHKAPRFKAHSQFTVYSMKNR